MDFSYKEKKTHSVKKSTDHLRDNFVAIISHELRTPLTYIKEGIAQVLEELHGPLNEDQKQLLTISYEGVERLATIVNDLLDISKIEACKVKKNKNIINVNHLVNKALNGYKSVFKKKKLDLIIDVPDKSFEVFIDREKIIQVLTNLVSNSYKFTDKGYVKVSVVKEKDQYVFSVQDSGSGINNSDLPKIFDNFVQVGRTYGPGKKGTGLGLGIVKGIVELHNGKVWVESEQDKGSCFYFSLPILDVNEILNELAENQIHLADARNTEFSLISIKIFKSEKLSEKQEINICHEMEVIINSALRRSADMVINLNVDEFFLILPDTNHRGLLSFLNRFKSTLIYHFENNKVIKYVKVGHANFPFDGDSGKMLINKAKLSKVVSYFEPERRKEIRLPIKVNINGINNRGDIIDFKTLNISEGGICISTRQYIELPEINELNLYFPDEKNEINTKTTVLWTKKNEKTKEYQVGLKFIDLAEKDQDALWEYLTKYNKRTRNVSLARKNKKNTGIDNLRTNNEN